MLNLYNSLASERNERLEMCAKLLKRSKLTRKLRLFNTSLWLDYKSALEDNEETDFQVKIKLIEEGKND